jgi:hypothetical protein
MPLFQDPSRPLPDLILRLLNIDMEEAGKYSSLATMRHWHYTLKTSCLYKLSPRSGRQQKKENEK